MNQAVIHMLSTSVPREKLFNLCLLGFRVLVAFAMIRTHGWKKVMDYSGTVQHIPDPFGIGGEISALIAVLANVVFAVFIGMGLFTRPSALFILGVTLTGFFVVHWNDPWIIKDVPLMYSTAFLLLLFLGAGSYSLDEILMRKMTVK